ncbi:MAG: DUF4233 domain-containing protein [Propionibacterium sp.]|nr:DUF4233 domain-containing protein [Propionibacterium sp.]
MGLVPGNPMIRVLSLQLLFDVVVFGLAYPGMVIVSNVGALPAGLAAGGAAVLAIASAATLRRPTGWPLAWATQLSGILLGLLTPMMYLVGAIFALIWVMSFVLGRRIDRAGTVGA